MKRLFTLILSAMMLIAISLPVFATDESPKFNYEETFLVQASWGFRQDGQWHQIGLYISSNDEDHYSISVGINVDDEYSYDQINFTGELLKQDFDYKKMNDLVLDITLSGDFYHNYYNYETGAVLNEEYTEDMTFDLIWTYMQNEYSFDNIHSTSGYTGATVYKHWVNVDSFNVTGTMNGIEVGDSEYATIMDYRSKNENNYYGTSSTDLSMQSQGQTLPEFSYEVSWASPTDDNPYGMQYSMYISYYPSIDDMATVNITAYRLDEYWNYVESTVFIAEVDPNLFDFPTKNDNGMLILMDFTGNESTYSIDAEWRWTLIGSETKTIHVDLNWAFEDYSLYRNNRIERSNGSVYHSTILVSNFLGPVEGSIGDSSIIGSWMSFFSDENRVH